MGYGVAHHRRFAHGVHRDVLAVMELTPDTSNEFMEWFYSG